MRTTDCICGQRLFFQSGSCISCGREVGFDPTAGELLALEGSAVGELVSAYGSGSGPYRHCANRREHDVCNWLVPAGSGDDLCLSCGLNEVIPNLSSPGGRERWAALEDAKRRLLATLLSIGLPVVGRRADPRGMAFAFLDDRESNPDVLEERVVTGHERGLITINAREAEPAARERVRTGLNEQYRTLLGHFRHESGHFYWFRLVDGSAHLESFREVFGDERADYDASLSSYYADGPANDWWKRFVSAYGSAHPHEDWAESWAHYLHLVDTLETAVDFGLVPAETEEAGFDGRVAAWMELTIAHNALNRSMGLADAYPFVLSAIAIEKLRFVSRVIEAPRPATGPPVAPPASA